MIVIFVILVLAILIPTYAFPMFEVPVPEGDSAVGTLTFELTDTTRDEYYTDAVDNRRVTIRVWYPVDPEDVSEMKPVKY